MLSVFLALLFLQSCIFPEPIYTRITFDDMPAWEQQNPVPVLKQMQQSIHYYERYPNYKAVVDALSTIELDSLSAKEARHFIETQFRPFSVADPNAENMVTGYYIPTIAASREQTTDFSVPLYKNPKKIFHKRRISRQAIMNGALRNLGLELAWLNNDLDAYTIQMQGSAFLSFADGSQALVHYAGSNGYAYASISEYMIQKGYIKAAERSVETVYGFLTNHPDKQAEVLAKNPAYAYFKFKADNTVVGAQGYALLPFRSVAVDKRFIPLGSLLFLDTAVPVLKKNGEIKRSVLGKVKHRPFQQLCIAQDQGGAIKGPLRADIYFGASAEAAVLAGFMTRPARFVVLRPAL